MRSVLELEFKFTVNIYGWSWEGKRNAVTGVDEITDFVLTQYGLHTVADVERVPTWVSSL